MSDILLNRRREMMSHATTQWLTPYAVQVINTTFEPDGKVVVDAANAYLDNLAITDITGAEWLAYIIDEDPLVVCSLGLNPQGVTIPERGLKSDGVAYIDSNYYIVRSSTKSDYRAEYKIKYSEPSGNHYHGFSANVGGFSGIADGTIIGTSVSASIYTGQLLKLAMWYKNNTVHYYVNDEEKGTSGGGGSNGNWYWLMLNYRTLQLNNPYDLLTEGTLYDTGEIVQRLIPLKTRNTWASADVSIGVAQAAGTHGMIDFVTHKFFPNANSSGDFTIPDIIYNPS